MVITSKDELIIISNTDEITLKLSGLLEKCNIMYQRVGYPIIYQHQLESLLEKITGIRSLFVTIDNYQKKIL